MPLAFFFFCRCHLGDDGDGDGDGDGDSLGRHSGGEAMMKSLVSQLPLRARSFSSDLAVRGDAAGLDRIRHGGDVAELCRWFWWDGMVSYYEAEEHGYDMLHVLDFILGLACRGCQGLRY